jgi:corrinoid protein of di/trimethylamine methyltransferase
MTSDEVIARLGDGIISGDKAAVISGVEEALRLGHAPLALVTEVLNPALQMVGERFGRGEMFLPELIVAAEAMQSAMEVLQPALEARQEKVQCPGRVVMATVKGDIHDIGKNIVTALLRANGFEVMDLGKDLAADVIVNAAERFKADVIGLSALLSTTLPYCRDTVRLLDERGLREKYRVFVGGGAVTPEYAKSIGAEYGGAHAEAAVASMRAAVGGRA